MKRGNIAIGDVLFAAQDAQDRVGELLFMCHTQCNAGPDAEKVIEEALEQLTHSDEADYKNGKWVPVVEPERAENLIVWAMIRVA
jgi:hypothetical protein